MNCAECGGACCETFSLPISAALPAGDSLQADINRWLALHATDDGERLTFECRCTKLSPDGRCSIYENRPVFCRTFQRNGPECLAIVRERRTAEDYSRIREDGDPDTLT
jgi:Fe-S-cluster containining protein